MHRKRRRRHEKIIGIQRILEERGRFHLDYGARYGRWEAPDARYAYRKRGIHRAVELLKRTLLFIFTPVINRLVFGAKVVGRKNLKELKGKGAVALCNHISWFDFAFARSALGQYRSYVTVAPFNNTKGLLGLVMGDSGTLPFSPNVRAMSNLNGEIARLLSKGKIICFYPEQALWDAYERPRPMKSGAFHYAVKFGVPVVPVFCTFKRTARCRIRRLRINVLKPLYPDESFDKLKRIDDLRARAENAWQECYMKTRE